MKRKYLSELVDLVSDRIEKGEMEFGQFSTCDGSDFYDGTARRDEMAANMTEAEVLASGYWSSWTTVVGGEIVLCCVIFPLREREPIAYMYIGDLHVADQCIEDELGLRFQSRLEQLNEKIVLLRGDYRNWDHTLALQKRAKQMMTEEEASK